MQLTPTCRPRRRGRRSRRRERRRRRRLPEPTTGRHRLPAAGAPPRRAGTRPERYARHRHLDGADPFARAPAGTRHRATRRPVGGRWSVCAVGTRAVTARSAATGTAPPRIATVPMASPACTNVSSRNPSNPWSSSAAASLNGSSAVAEHDRHQSPPVAFGGRDQAEARPGRVPGLHAGRSRVEPQQRVAVLHAPRRPRRSRDRPELRRDDAGEPGLRRRPPGRARAGRARSIGPRSSSPFGEKNSVSRIPRASRPVVHEPDEPLLRSAHVDREGDGRVVRRLQHQGVEELPHGAPLPRAQPERRGSAVVVVVEDRLGRDHHDVVELEPARARGARSSPSSGSRSGGGPPAPSRT